MADAQTEQEPSIEEILESIRQIISDDDEEAEGETGAAAEEAATPEPDSALVAESVEPEPAAELPPEPEPEPEPELPVLDLTEKVEDEDSVVEVDLTPAAETVAETEVEPVDEGAPLISEGAASASADELAKLLAQNIAVERELPGRPGNVTLEDITYDIMRPLVKAWLDENLPDLIEGLVRKEIERISHRVLGGK